MRNFFAAFGLGTRLEIVRLQIFMRSGNSFIIDEVDDYSFRYTENRIVGVRIGQSAKAKSKLLVGTIALDQIESVVVLPRYA